MKNERGSIMVITLSFVLIFTLLGFASLNYAGMQNQMAERMEKSSEALWIADGALQRALALVPNHLANTGSGVLGNGTYTLVTTKTLPYNFRWDVTSSGTVNVFDPSGNTIPQLRTIQAVISGADIYGVYNSNGPLDRYDSLTGECGFPGYVGETPYSPENNCKLINPNLGFTFSSLFPNATLPLVPDQAYADDGSAPNYNNLPVLSGLTIITIANTNTNGFDGSNPIEGTGFVYIDVTRSGVTNINMEISNFSGIIYIAGANVDVDIHGNTTLHGALFIESQIEARINGNQTLMFDASAIDNALAQVNASGSNPGRPSIVSWKEI